MTNEQLSAAIRDLSPENAAFAAAEAIIRLGQCGREAGELLAGQVEGMDDSDRCDFAEGQGWVEDITAD
jgi:hypothetical protein